GISWVSKPIREKTSTAPAPGTSSTYLPFRSVLVPMLVLFLTDTDTPGRGAPLVSTTFPVICRSWSRNSARGPVAPGTSPSNKNPPPPEGLSACGSSVARRGTVGPKWQTTQKTRNKQTLTLFSNCSLIYCLVFCKN